MYELDLEKAEEPEIKFPIPIGWITTNWKILKEMAIPDHFTCLLRNLFAGQEVELDMEQWTGSKLGKEYIKGCILSPCYFN